MTSSPSDRPREVKVECTKCKKAFVESDDRRLTTSADKLEIDCPHCSRSSELPSEAVGCPGCRQNFRVADRLLGQDIACPACRCLIHLPTEEERLEDLGKDETFEWRIVSAVSGEETVTADRDELVALLIDRAAGPEDLCATRDLAAWQTLRKACDEHYSLQKLYDPVAAYAGQTGTIVAALFALGYLVSHVVAGLANMGASTYLSAAIIGILAVVLTPTIIGLVVMFFVARAFEVPLLGAYLGVLVSAVLAFLAAGLGYAIGFGLAWLVLKAMGIGRQPTVDWSGPVVDRSGSDAVAEPGP